MKRQILIIILLGLYTQSPAQLRVVSVEQVPLSGNEQWSTPKFSQGGKSIFYTTSDFQGIREYSLVDGKDRLVTDAQRSGYGFALSSDGTKIAFRSSLYEGGTFNRTQEILLKDLTSGLSEVLAIGPTLSLPAFVGMKVLVSDGVVTRNLKATVDGATPVLLGIEDTKIVLIENGKKRLLDPLKGGSYIWPTLSPDGQHIVACEISRGTFVSDLDGNVISMLGKRNGAVWTRDGQWLIYMDDKDDGHDLVSSDLYCISPDGSIVQQLTFTPQVIELFPQCSPANNQIVFSTYDGKISILNYEEVGK